MKTPTAEPSASSEQPRRRTPMQLVSYFGVSATQTVVEFAVFAALQLTGLPEPMPAAGSIVCSGAYNFVMNRNLTFKSSSNLARSIALFVLLYLWNFAFLQLMLGMLPALLGWDPLVVKLFTMACQGVWGFLLSKYVIFR